MLYLDYKSKNVLHLQVAALVIIKCLRLNQHRLRKLGKNKQGDMEESEGVMPCSPAEWDYGLLKGRKKRGVGGVSENFTLSPSTQGRLQLSQWLPLSSSRTPVRFPFLHTPFDPWGSTQLLTHINYTLLQLLLTQAYGWHGMHTPALSISCIFLPLSLFHLFFLCSCKNAP